MKELSICILLSVWSCTTNESALKNTEQIDHKNTQAAHFEVPKLKKGDSLVYQDSTYAIIISPLFGQVGDSIVVFNKKNNHSFSIAEFATSYQGVADSILITDEGTSFYHTSSLYSLNSGKNIFHASGEGATLKDGKFYFQAIVPNEKVKVKPKCEFDVKEIDEQNREILYIEEQIYDLRTKNIIHTHNYECGLSE